MMTAANEEGVMVLLIRVHVDVTTVAPPPAHLILLEAGPSGVDRAWWDGLLRGHGTTRW